MKVSAVVPAAGKGERFGREDKLFASLAGRPVLRRTLDALAAAPEISEVVLVLSEERIGRFRAELAGKVKVSKVVQGGAERFDSVWRGLGETAPDSEIVLIHDAVRPLVALDWIRQTVQKASELGGAIAAIPVFDTVKRSVDGRTILKTVPRESLWRAQTPQAFRRGPFLQACQRAIEEGFSPSDDAGVAERYGIAVGIVRASERNLKITTPEDLAYAEYLISS